METEPLKNTLKHNIASKMFKLTFSGKIKIQTTKITTEYNTRSFTESHVYRVTDSYKIKPTIPILHEPSWKSMLHWRNLQKPTLVQFVKELNEDKHNKKVSNIPS